MTKPSTRARGLRNCRRCGALTDQPQSLCADASACIASAFWQKVDKSGGPDACWLWLGRFSDDGYGKFLYRTGNERRTTVRAHRFAMHLDGFVLGDLCACHRCDNPKCCNPAHLFAGTQRDNVRDRQEKGRTPSGARWHEKNKWFKLSEVQALEIRRRYNAGEKSVALATEFGIWPQTVTRIARGARWKHVA